MKPTPRTAEALSELARQGEVSLGIELYAMARRVRAVVPELIGLSLGVVQDGVTLTLVSTATELAALDAVQYVGGGPCVAAAHRAEPVDINLRDLLDEGQWQLFARAAAAHGVATTLSLPIMSGDRAIGSVNLYAAGQDAFRGLHEEVAAAVGSDAALAVTNADLSFRTLAAAQEAPTRVREGGDISIALGIISADQGVDIPTARQRLFNAAERAGVSEAQAALTIKHLWTP